MLDRLRERSSGEKQSGEVGVCVCEVVTQLDRFAVMRRGLVVHALAGEGKTKVIVEQSGAHLGMDFAVTNDGQSALVMGDRVIETAPFDIKESEVVVSDRVIGGDGKRVLPKCLRVLPRGGLFPGKRC